MKIYQNYINGKWMDSLSKEKIHVEDPATTNIIGEIACAKDDDVDMAVDLVKDWGGITSDGEPVPYTKKRCRDLLSESPVNVDRILDFCGERVNFTKG